MLNGEKLCSQGWEEYKEHCYRFNTKLIKWHEAEIECRKQEGYLLKIEDANEFRWIVARAKAHSVHDIWIAGSAPSYVNKDEETGFPIESFKRNKKKKI
ncbi:Hypothetical predicted protein [Mytilus galloprovincialis]|uniref:C-type lectin domain-containing protein n=1 Tax=Mytilus galloprovincialis TaxID=29158 RepID=A0A8B6F8P8_MYTGA|nr:Hypothetical predicted protein [Mytilus galloprovincialis]